MKLVSNQKCSKNKGQVWECAEGFTLRCGDAYLKITPEGELHLSAKALKLWADGPCEISGQAIHLRTEDEPCGQ